MYKTHIKPESNFLWTSFDNAAELNNEIDTIIERLKAADISAIKDAYRYFLPTSTFQEHSLMNDWSNTYMELAEKIDAIYERNKDTIDDYL